ncbi:MAG: SapC family protein [Caulobacteraceae bacterium]|nr:SapC family protein [Caulobacteraceae bacterium]
MADASADSLGLSGQVLFYSRPEPLDAQRHAGLGMKNTMRPYGFAASQHFIPLHVGEFGPAAVNYPIIFAGAEHTPLAVMGLRPGENLFISPEGEFRIGAYVPSFIRRYPFVGARDGQSDRVVVCIDRASNLWTEDAPDVKLFENGQPSAYTKACIDFCSQFDADRAITESFVKLLTDLDLLTNQQTHFTPRLADGAAGEPQLVAEYSAVSAEKLKALPGEKLAELRDNGALAQIYSHLTSLQGWDRIVMESLARAAAAAPAGRA